MRVSFLGTGDAFDRQRYNSAFLVEELGVSLLLDCGYTGLVPLLRSAVRPDLVFISHFHPDHCAGLPRLIMQGRQEIWKQPLRIIGPKGTSSWLDRITDAFYGPKAFDALPFGLLIQEVSPGEILTFGGLSLRFARARHTAESLAVLLAGSSSSLAYSGDTLPAPEVAQLARNVNLLIHDGFHEPAAPEPRSHATWTEALDTARQAKARRLAFVHVRAGQHQSLAEWAKAAALTFEGELLVPADGDAIAV